MGHEQGTAGESVAANTVFSGVFVVCVATADFAIMRYIEAIPIAAVIICAVIAGLASAVVFARQWLRKVHPKAVPVLLTILGAAYLVPFGYVYYTLPPAGEKWEYHWVDLEQKGDWGGADVGCTLTNIPAPSFCGEPVNGRYAVCWDRSPTSESEACPNMIIQQRVLCTYKDRVVTGKTQPNGPNPGFLFQCRKVQVK
jgi:hypothetical protein